jgi:hypothetical protein
MGASKERACELKNVDELENERAQAGNVMADRHQELRGGRGLRIRSPCRLQCSDFFPSACVSLFQ